jgi:hypothetical protein
MVTLTPSCLIHKDRCLSAVPIAVHEKRIRLTSEMITSNFKYMLQQEYARFCKKTEILYPFGSQEN